MTLTQHQAVEIALGILENSIEDPSVAERAETYESATHTLWSRNILRLRAQLSSPTTDGIDGLKNFILRLERTNSSIIGEAYLSFSETFDFSTIFYVGYAVYLGVTSVVSIFWILFTRRYHRSAIDSASGIVGTVLKNQYKLVYLLLRLGRPITVSPPACPSYRQIFTVAGTTGVALATVSGIIVVSLQWVESLS